MNKLTKSFGKIALAAVLCTSAAFAKAAPTTAAEYRAAFEQLMATNKAVRGSIATKLGFWNITARPDLRELRLEFDEAFAADGWGVFTCAALSKSWPKTSAIAREAYGWSTNFPVRVAVANRLDANANYGSLVYRGATYEECVAMLAELSEAPRLGVAMSELDIVKKGVQDRAAKIIKRRLRETGKSFVTKDGVNPVAQRLQSLATALNAPRLAGLNEWNAELGIDAARVDVMKGFSDADVQKLKDDIFYGDRQMDGMSQQVLFFCLGVDGYNAFVKEYNGDK